MTDDGSGYSRQGKLVKSTTSVHVTHYVESPEGIDYEVHDGLAFAIGVAVQESIIRAGGKITLAASPTDTYVVKHPNGVPIVYVNFLNGNAVVTMVR